MLPQQVQAAQIQRQVLKAEFQVKLCRAFGPQTQSGGLRVVQNCCFAPSLGRHTRTHRPIRLAARPPSTPAKVHRSLSNAT
jgi:hypothetical protein